MYAIRPLHPTLLELVTSVITGEEYASAYEAPACTYKEPNSDTVKIA